MNSRPIRTAGAIASTIGLTGTALFAVTPSLTDAVAAAAPVTSSVPACATAPLINSTLAGIQISNPNCDPSDPSGTKVFSSLDGSTVYTGLIADTPAGGFTNGGQSAWRVEVPANWNGTLVMFAHGYAGTGNVVGVGDPQLRQYFVDHGYAWAASSYAMNGYDVGTGTVDTHDLLQAFPSITGLNPTTTIMSGLSMGGAITVVELENYHGDYNGGMPYCGVVGGNDLFNFFDAANVTAAAVTGTKIQFPSVANAAAYVPTYDAAVNSELPTLGISNASFPFKTNLTAAGQEWSTAVEQASGGTRPGFGPSLAYWNSFGFAPLSNVPFLFGLYPGLTGGGIGFLPGNVTDNTSTFYKFSTAPGHSDPVSRQLNSQVLRVSRTVPFNTDPTTTELPDVTGTPGVPVVSVHGLGDLFVPFSMEQDYARLADASGQGNLFVSRAIRETAHCGYTTPELQSAFDGLVSWIHTGQQPAGDRILNPQAVSSPTFGCRFTLSTRPGFDPCPPSSGPGQGKN